VKYKKVLITGGTGSLGHALAARFQTLGSDVVIFSRDEKKQYDMKKLFPEYTYKLGDIRDYAAVRDAVRDIDIVIHGASLKYVNISELQPSEYVSTNVMGTLNLVNAVLDEKTVERCVGISTDKACMPVNTYGYTKALLEKLFLEACNRQGKKGTTIFNVARYGNVIGTRGSVLPFWKERREAGATLPITNPDMTRFFFTLEDAVALIEYCLTGVGPGLIVSQEMESVTLGELAEVMRGYSEIEIVGERPGEKHHEGLLTADEMSRTYLDRGYFIYNPSSPPLTETNAHYTEYNSFIAKRMDKEQLKADLVEWIY